MPKRKKNTNKENGIYSGQPIALASSLKTIRPNTRQPTANE